VKIRIERPLLLLVDTRQKPWVALPDYGPVQGCTGGSDANQIQCWCEFASGSITTDTNFLPQTHSSGCPDARKINTL